MTFFHFHLILSDKFIFVNNSIVLISAIHKSLDQPKKLITNDEIYLQTLTTERPDPYQVKCRIELNRRIKRSSIQMKWFSTTLTLKSSGKGLYDFTSDINTQINQWKVNEGMAFLFVQHTSASLVINENYASSARRDMESFLKHIAPEGEDWYEHTMEGSDDSPAHMRTMITPTSMTVPIENGKLNLGTWQGIFLAEHRRGRQHRKVLLRVISMD